MSEEKEDLFDDEYEEIINLAYDLFKKCDEKHYITHNTIRKEEVVEFWVIQAMLKLGYRKTKGE